MFKNHFFFGRFSRGKILKPPVGSRNAQKAPNTEAPQSLAARKVSKKTTKRRKTKVVKSKSKKSIKTAVNEVEYCDIVESCHVKHPRVDMDGNVHLRWFAVVAHVMPVFLYSYLFDTGMNRLTIPRGFNLTERENPPTLDHCQVNWCERIRGYSLIDISNCLAKMRRVWIDTNGGVTLLPDEFRAENSQPETSYSDRVARCLSKIQWQSFRAVLFPLSLNALGEEVDPLNKHEDPENVDVYPPLLTTRTLLQLTVYATRPSSEKAIFKGGPFKKCPFGLSAKLRSKNASKVFPPDNGGLEMEFGEGTRYPFLDEQAIESISLLSLFREIRERAKILKHDQLIEHVRVTWFQLCEVAYKRRRQAHIEAQSCDSDSLERDEMAVFDAVSGASLVFD